jgi:dTDP-4-amino-4,6-dideoxygalactose transaminase
MTYVLPVLSPEHRLRDISLSLASPLRSSKQIKQYRMKYMNYQRPRRDSFLVFGAPLIEKEEIAEVVATLESGWLGTGPRTAEFERMFAEYTGARHAIAVNSCTAGLHLSLVALGVGPGDEVITTPMTFAATANVILHVGARPVFADVLPDTMVIDPEQIEKAVTPRTRAILPVHIAGRPCDMDAIRKIAERHRLHVIEDAAHCIEGRYKGRQIGSISPLTCFSFYVTKNLTTGEGGMITTDNDEWARILRMYRLHGMSRDAWKRFSGEGYKHYQVVYPGFKYNMMDLQAALGIHQLRRVERNWECRNAIWQRYTEYLRDLPVGLPAPDEPNTRHARHLYTILVDKARCGLSRDEMLDALRAENIGAGVHYTALHLHPYYREELGYKEGDYPHSEWIGERTLSLPLSALLSDEDVEDVVTAVCRILQRRRRP